jgi:hypothetical protein
MKLFRRFGFALLLAFALVAGQQAAALHELGHATGQYAPKHGTKGNTGCDTHYLYSQLGSAANAAKSVAPVVACTPPQSPLYAWHAASPVARFAFNPRAPPTLL